MKELFLRTHLFDMVYSLRDVVCLPINEFLYPSNTVVKMQTVSTLDFEQYFLSYWELNLYL